MHVKTWLNQWKTEHALLSNAISMMGTTAVTSGLGFVYWWIAARLYSEESVGLASAAISMMLLFGTIGMFGFGTLLIGRLPKHPEKAGDLIVTSLSISGSVSFVLGIVVAIGISYLSQDLAALGQDLFTILLFALGVALTSIAFVSDQALVGLLRTDLQLGRNTVFAAAKLIVLIAAGKLIQEVTGFTIYITWLLGNLISFALLIAIPMAQGKLVITRPRWSVVRSLGSATLEHFALNTALQAPNLLLPVIVTVMLSAVANASFYVAWMIASFTFVVPISLSTVLYAISAADTSTIAQKLRFTLMLSALTGLVANVLFIIFAPHILSFFGPHYAERASTTLRLLALGIFPLTLKIHYVAINRIFNQVGNAAKWIAIGGAVELIGAAIGASLGSVDALSLGWLVAICFEALFMIPSVYKTAAPAVLLHSKPDIVSPIEHQ